MSTFCLKVWGGHACFTRPEMKVERVSYDVMTPSAARGILEAILWKPAIRWVITRIDVLNPIRMETVRRNEVGSRISAGPVRTAMKRQAGTLGLFIEDDRQQRAATLLRDVAYLIHARFDLTRPGPDDSAGKFLGMFERRATRGQCFHRPYLGCREFAAQFELAPKDKTPPAPIEETRDLGWMLYDLDYADHYRPRFFQARLKNGIVIVPPWDSPEVKG
ncbi:MAG: type I-C CRISPR-associated protein Cas5c [Nitrospinaceae bacterium]